VAITRPAFSSPFQFRKQTDHYMRNCNLHFAVMSFLINILGCGSGDSAPTSASAGENKSMSPAEVQKELEKLSPPATGKASLEKKSYQKRPVFSRPFLLASYA
jgi:hypothetical protein